MLLFQEGKHEDRPADGGEGIERLVLIQSKQYLQRRFYEFSLWTFFLVNLRIFRQTHLRIESTYVNLIPMAILGSKSWVFDRFRSNSDPGILLKHSGPFWPRPRLSFPQGSPEIRRSWKTGTASSTSGAEALWHYYGVCSTSHKWIDEKCHNGLIMDSWIKT